ncbi:hypothetical protein Cni_G17317 [Canna indica]|uniref:Calmodulin-binding domain-containing protein n=1 Tax=Canna indica TaxID=4628 RepID=A0AAQ3QEZ7_9LILI|nr:hypothetical protein Cni_G17317 [Canna indica]
MATPKPSTHVRRSSLSSAPASLDDPLRRKTTKSSVPNSPELEAHPAARKSLNKSVSDTATKVGKTPSIANATAGATKSRLPARKPAAEKPPSPSRQPIKPSSPSRQTTKPSSPSRQPTKPSSPSRQPIKQSSPSRRPTKPAAVVSNVAKDRTAKPSATIFPRATFSSKPTSTPARPSLKTGGTAQSSVRGKSPASVISIRKETGGASRRASEEPVAADETDLKEVEIHNEEHETVSVTSMDDHVSEEHSEHNKTSIEEKAGEVNTDNLDDVVDENSEQVTEDNNEEHTADEKAVEEHEASPLKQELDDDDNYEGNQVDDSAKEELLQDIEEKPDAEIIEDPEDEPHTEVEKLETETEVADLVAVTPEKIEAEEEEKEVEEEEEKPPTADPEKTEDDTEKNKASMAEAEATPEKNEVEAEESNEKIVEEKGGEEAASKKQAAAAVQAKKEAQISNDVIEETRSKLLEKKKSKVRALVGAFETVMQLQDSES